MTVPFCGLIFQEVLLGLYQYHHDKWAVNDYLLCVLCDLQILKPESVQLEQQRMRKKFFSTLWKGFMTLWWVGGYWPCFGRFISTETLLVADPVLKLNGSLDERTDFKDTLIFFFLLVCCYILRNNLDLDLIFHFSFLIKVIRSPFLAAH